MAELLESILRSMSSVNKAQKQFIIILLNTLMSFRGKATFRNLSRYCSMHEKTFSRWFREYFNFQRFNFELLHQALPESSPKIAAIDASFMKKSGKKTDGIGDFYSSDAGAFMKGLELSTIAVIDLKANTAYALDSRQTIDDPEQKKTRMELYCEQIKNSAMHLKKLGIKHMVGDGYYTNSEIIHAVQAEKLEYIGRLRHDADLRFPFVSEKNKRGRPKQYGSKVCFKTGIPDGFAYEGTLDNGEQVYSAVVWWYILQKKVKVVLLNNPQQPNRKKLLFLTTDLSLNGFEVMGYYKARFQIEYLFRDGKQFTGLMHCQARNRQAIHTQINASLTALNILKIEDKKLQGTHSQSVISIATWKRKKFNQNFMKIIFGRLGICLKTEKNREIYEKLSDYGAIAA